MSEFRRVLSEQRTLDDRIIYELNSSIPTASFATGNTAETKCAGLHAQIKKAFEQRQAGLQNCINVLSAEILSLSQGVDASDHRAEQGKGKTSVEQSDLRTKQTLLRQVKAELRAEAILEEQTMTLFQERCGRFIKK